MLILQVRDSYRSRGIISTKYNNIIVFLEDLFSYLYQKALEQIEHLILDPGWKNKNLLTIRFALLDFWADPVQ